MEYVVGFEFLRCPDALLDEGAIVETHTHNHHHNTHLTRGLWDVYRFEPLVGADGVQLKDDKGTLLWHGLDKLTIEGGMPGSIIPIPANMMHRFELIKGPGFYFCAFSHRDEDGNPAEAYGGRYVHYV